MRNAAIAFTLAFAIGFFAAPTPSTGFVPQAEAGNVFKAALVSFDAGPTNAVTLETMREFELTCPQASCYKLGASNTAASTVPDCTKDFILGNSELYLGVGNTEVRRYREHIKSGGFTAVRVRALDGGNVAGCQIYSSIAVSGQ